MKSLKLVIFDFDGTLFDTHASIAHCISRTFALLSPPQAPIPSLPAIHAIIAKGVGLSDTFQMLQAGGANPRAVTNMEVWLTTYRTLYADEGLPLIAPFPNAHALLQSLRAKAIPVVILSNKGIAAVTAVLAQAGLTGSVDLVLGDMPGVRRKPDPMAFVDIIAPWYAGSRARDEQGYVASSVEQLRPEEVLVVGDTVADVMFARNVGAVPCWARYGYGDKVECENLNPDVVVDSLEEVGVFVQRAGEQG